MAATCETVVRDSSTGQVRGSAPQSLHERYPLGRKFCTCCGRWRHLADFPPRRGNPQPWCHCCNNRRNRLDRLKARLERDAPNRARAVVALLAAESQPFRWSSRSEKLQIRREWWARWMTTIKADPKLHQEYLETTRLRQWETRRKEGKPERPRRKPEPLSELVNPALFLEWLSWHDVSRTEYETKCIKKYNDGRTQGLSIGLIDKIMTRAGAIDQFDIFDSAGWPGPK